jgi:alpha-tubulin suppressor-like RCC1 family protein
MRNAFLFRSRIVLILALALPILASYAVANDVVFRELTLGFYHTCGLSQDARVFCWGDNRQGQLGNNSKLEKLIPSEVDTRNLNPEERFTKITSGSFHTCGLTNLNNVFCWGGDNLGNLGIGTYQDRYVPTALDTRNIPRDEHITQLSSGSNHSCAITSKGKTFCWGNNYHGQLKFFREEMSNVPVYTYSPVLSYAKKFVALSSGGFHTCGVTTEKEIFCWGDNEFGQLGRKILSPARGQYGRVTAGPNTFNAGEEITMLAGGTHTCGYSNSGIPFCWGENYYGQLGDNSKTSNPNPTKVDLRNLTEGERFTSLSTKYDYNCGLTNIGKAYCWGRNSYGQLGDGSKIDKSIPTPIDTKKLASEERFTALFPGIYHTCGITNQGNTFCWGKNNFGQHGKNSKSNSYNFSKVDTSNVLTGE